MNQSKADGQYTNTCTNEATSNIGMLSLTVTMGKMAPYSDRERSPSHQNYSSTMDDAERAVERNQEKPEKRTSNEYALGVAFWSFVIFTATQFFFAITANSSAMMTDCEAMVVDSLTYLFNLVAERLKRSSISEDDANAMHPKILAYRRERLRLYLELCPPLISATILMIVTFSATQGALKSLSRSHHHDNVNVNLMLIFSFGNLLLDVLNVGCFANAHQAYGIGEVEKEKVLYSTSREARREEEISENTNLLPNGDLSFDLYDIDEEPPKKPRMALNLNMCSAYTVSELQFIVQR